MIARKRLDSRERHRKAATRLGAVRLNAAGISDEERARPNAPSRSSNTDYAQPSPHRSATPVRTRDVPADTGRCLKTHTPSAPDSPWDMVQEVFKKLADGDIPGNSDPLRPSILGKGIGAINAVGKAAVQVANTLDHAVEHLFEGWNSPSLPAVATGEAECAGLEDRSASCKSGEGDEGGKRVPESASTACHCAWEAGPTGVGVHNQQPQPPQNRGQQGRRDRADVASTKEAALLRRSARVAETSNKEATSTAGKAAGARVKDLQDELQKLRTTQAEYLQLREQLNKVQAELTYTSNKCSALSRENDLLREHNSCPAPHAAVEGDPIAEQVAAQLQALLQEKAKLAHENARLAHENSSLQELLDYTISTAPCEEDSSCHDVEEEWSADEASNTHMSLCPAPLTEMRSPGQEA